MTSSFAIETVKLTKKFKRQRGLVQLLSGRPSDRITAVDGVTLGIGQGEIVGLLGPNGAGKTTLIKMLSTLLLPSSGDAYIFGHHAVRESHRVKKLIGLVASEERSFFWRLTGRQNLEFFAALYKVPRREARDWIAELLGLFGLSDVADARFNEYSTGMRQKLAIARGLLSRPKILYMDEPTKGLDPVSAQDLLGIIRQKVAGHLGSTVLMTTHILRDLEQLCHRIAVMNKGKVLACATLDELRSMFRGGDRYRLHVTRFSDAGLLDVGRVEGVLNCTKVSQDNGVMEISIELRKGSAALSTALERILRSRCEIVRCSLEEGKLEEVFTHLMEPDKGR